MDTTVYPTFFQIADINTSYYGQDQTIHFGLDSADYILVQKSFAVGHCYHFRYRWQAMIHKKEH